MLMSTKQHWAWNSQYYIKYTLNRCLKYIRYFMLNSKLLERQFVIQKESNTCEQNVYRRFHVMNKNITSHIT